MSRVCQITGKKFLTGNNVSHANNRTKMKQLPNLQSKRVWDEESKKFIRMRISTSAIKTLDKKGVKKLVKK
ncbi:MAG TPA: 50S ribosomal protein L28 [Ignavibacteria bacterium]|nr:50S ribosomal protein L28 [Ignavibacteria bacterium]